jgi:hypothetical protein
VKPPWTTSHLELQQQQQQQLRLTHHTDEP